MSPLSFLSRVGVGSLVALALAPAFPAHAADGTFSQTASGTYSWDTPGNWSGNVIADGSGSTANFTSGTTGTINVTVNSDRIIGNLTFGNHAWTLQGPDKLTLTGGATPVITVSSSTATISARLDGSQGLRTNGSLTLSGNNLYTGTTTVVGGSLTVAHNNALGGSGVGNGTTVNSGLTLFLNNGITVSNESLTISGAGSGSYGAIQANGTAEWTGDVTLAATNTRVGTVNSSSQLTLSGNISGSQILYISGQGTTVLSGANNTYSGGTLIYRGTLKLNGGDNRLPTATLLTMGGTADNSNFNLNGYNQQLAGVLNSTNTSTRTITNSSGTAATLTLNGSTDRSFFGTSTSITGNLSLVKAGTFTQTLAQTNSYTGNTTVSAGTLVLADNATMTFTIGANGINNQINGSGTLTLNGDFIFDLTGAAEVNGNSWNLVNVGTLAETFGGTFTVQGFTNNAGVWTFGNYQFSQATGVLSYGVIPEPATLGMLALGLFGCVALRRFRKLGSR